MGIEDHEELSRPRTKNYASALPLPALIAAGFLRCLVSRYMRPNSRSQYSIIIRSWRSTAYLKFQKQVGEVMHLPVFRVQLVRPTRSGQESRPRQHTDPSVAN